MIISLDGSYSCLPLSSRCGKVSQMNKQNSWPNWRKDVRSATGYFLSHPQIEKVWRPCTSTTNRLLKVNKGYHKNFGNCLFKRPVNGKWCFIVSASRKSARLLQWLLFLFCFLFKPSKLTKFYKKSLQQPKTWKRNTFPTRIYHHTKNREIIESHI